MLVDRTVSNKRTNQNMSEKVIVKAEKRENSGKGYARRLRVAGRVPVTVYGGR